MCPAINLQESLTSNEIELLKDEFPHYEFLTQSPFEWNQVEILYGNRLTKEELSLATRLRWVHSPTSEIDLLCLDEIKEQGNIALTLTKGQNVAQIAEFVIGAILAFSKQFFHWPEVSHDSMEFWQWPLKDTMWSLQKKILLQVGLGEVGTAIVRVANSLGMKTWGARPNRSFHPYCKKTFSFQNLHSILPVADVVSLALPKKIDAPILFGRDEFELMKRDSIFILIGSADWIDEGALSQIAKTGKFRGILLDAFKNPSPAVNSPLWEMPNAILTPFVASHPESQEHIAFRIFRKNLRLFVLGKINEMKNLVFP